MNFLITGTAGFIGFSLTRRLLREGHVVVGFDGMTPYYDGGLKQARYAILQKSNAFTSVNGMLEDAAALRRAADLVTPDVIVHLAAQAGVRYSLENPRAYIDSNVVGSWNLFELAKAVAPKHLLVASTSAVYGGNESVPFRETDRADEPMSLYAATKKSMEAMAHSYAHLFRIPTTVFRFFTVYGPWARPDMALFKFADAISAGRPIEVYGEGRMSRDFTFIDDLIEGIVRLVPVVPAQRIEAAAELDTLSHTAPYRVVNIGTGDPVGLTDFIAAIEKSIGKPAIKQMRPMQPGDVPRTFASPDLLQALTGYRPATPIAAGVEAFVDWYRGYIASRAS
jgi:UDP-glucuronate 4-epimerase